ncbi:MAG: hypothetical protein ABGX27_05870 [Desulfurobacteriaceae bacterium]
MLSEDIVKAIEKAFKEEGVDLRLEFPLLEMWDEAIGLIQGMIRENRINYISLHDTFRIEYLLENGNVIFVSYQPLQET